MVKARRSADKERLMFWFNVRFMIYSGMHAAEHALGRTRMFLVRRADDGDWALED